MYYSHHHYYSAGLAGAFGVRLRLLRGERVAVDGVVCKAASIISIMPLGGTPSRKADRRRWQGSASRTYIRLNH